MRNFLLREINSNMIETELVQIGFDSSYLKKAAEKFRYKNIKVYNLSTAQANILKQTALIFGADCAVNRNVITAQIEKSDAILCGSFSQLNKIADKLKFQPFKLGILAEEIKEFLKPERRKTKITGILNITPDSFSDGGEYLKPNDAIKRFEELILDGADMIDIGAESTRPGAEPVGFKEQIERLKPVFDFIRKEKPEIKISVDTRCAEVADYVLNNGADLINDVSGLEYDSKLTDVVSKYNAGVIIQHSKCTPSDFPVYKNVVEEVFSSLKNKIEAAKNAGIKDIIIDPGIGFGKSREDNLLLLDNIRAFYALECPVMVGISRKRLLGIEEENNDLKDIFTLTHSYPLIKTGVDFLRVHNVKLHKTFLNSLPTQAIYIQNKIM